MAKKPSTFTSSTPRIQSHAPSSVVMVVLPWRSSCSLSLQQRNCFNTTVSCTPCPYVVTCHNQGLALGQAAWFSFSLPEHKQTLRCTHTCGSLHLHLFS